MDNEKVYPAWVPIAIIIGINLARILVDMFIEGRRAVAKIQDMQREYSESLNKIMEESGKEENV